MNITTILLVGAVGFLGSVARYVTVISVDRKFSSLFPYGTAAVNIAGSFLLGLILAGIMKKTGSYSEEWKLFLATGFCGGFTTFSAFAGENLVLFQQKFPGTALFYIAFSLIGGLLAVWGGYALARNIF